MTIEPRTSSATGGLPGQLHDLDPAETREWVESLDQVVDHAGRNRARYLTSRLQGQPDPVVAVSDWMRAVPDQIAPFVPGRWSSLGTDGFGLSDTRTALRRHFRVDGPSIVLRVLEQLVDSGELDGSVVPKAIQTYRRGDDR